MNNDSKGQQTQTGTVCLTEAGTRGPETQAQRALDWLELDWTGFSREMDVNE